MQHAIDSHCHVSPRWYEPLETLLFQMDRCQVERAVLIQLLGGNDDGAMKAAVRDHPDRFCWVGALNPTEDAWREAISRAHDGGAAGLRMRANWRSAGEYPLAIWREVDRCGLTISMVGPASSFTDGMLWQVATEFPQLQIVLEHCGGLARPDVGDREAMLGHICDLAALPNISLKLPGLGQLAPRLPSPDAAEQPLDFSGIEPLLRKIIKNYGGKRLMWGSDFPPVAGREGYANALSWSRDFIGQHWPDTIGDAFSGTAARIWFGQ